MACDIEEVRCLGIVKDITLLCCGPVPRMVSVTFFWGGHVYQQLDVVVYLPPNNEDGDLDSTWSAGVSLFSSIDVIHGLFMDGMI